MTSILLRSLCVKSPYLGNITAGNGHGATVIARDIWPSLALSRRVSLRTRINEIWL